MALKHIATFCRHLELLHPFPDGNGRVAVNVILNYLLVKNGFIPATFYEPNIFDMYSEDELVDCIKDGMGYTLLCAKTPDIKLFGYLPKKTIDSSSKPLTDVITSQNQELKEDTGKLAQCLIELESLCDTTFNKKYSAHRYSGMGDIRKIIDIGHENFVKQCRVLAPNHTSPLYKGRNPLHIACKMGNSEVANHIIDADKDSLEQVDAYGNTPIFYAIEANNSALINKLISSGASLVIKNIHEDLPPGGTYQIKIM